MKPYYTWRDVEKILRNVPEPPWRGFSADNRTLSVYCAPENEAACRAHLQKVLASRLSITPEHAQVEMASAGARRFLEVVFQDEIPPLNRRPGRPLWAESDRPVSEPKAFPLDAPPIAAFYSFKGGVGRTTTLLATLGALLDRKKPGRVLVVDADLEAPGLTLQIPGPPDRFTLLDFFALVHDADNWQDEAIPIAADRLALPISLDLDIGGREIYFLPSFDLEQLPEEPLSPVDDDALFLRSLLPEQLIRRPGRSYVIADALSALGKALRVDVILVDLRAGVSELASPFLLDPRISRVLVSAASKQSFDGTRHVLRRLRMVTERAQAEVVLTMIHDGQDVSEKVGILQRELMPDDQADVPTDLSTPNVHEVPFAQELQDFASLEELLNKKLPGTSLGKKTARDIAASLWPEPPSEPPPPESPVTLAEVAQLARDLEFAEQNTVLRLLPTKPLRDLVESARENLPSTVVIGGKGAGKTYAWGQMVIAGSWKSFAAQITPNGNRSSALVFPLLSPLHLDDRLRETMLNAESAVRRALGTSEEPKSTDAELRRALADTEQGPQGLDFWVSAIASRLGFRADHLHGLVARLAQSGVAVCLAIDGLEDALQIAPGEPMHPRRRSRLLALLTELVPAIRDLRSPSLGAVVYVRRDIAQQAIVQNFGQFESQYRLWAFLWTPTEALRLAAWLLNEAGFLKFADFGNASYDTLRQVLAPFWGTRMGGERSKEPYTDKWVIAALSDYQGRLQARDLVRLMANASRTSAERNLSKVSAASLRSALHECSQKKIEELKQETPDLAPVLERLSSARPEDKKMPFRPETFQLTADQVKFLEDQGIVAVGDQGELFLPEIIRHGLGFTLVGGRRPAVLKMHRQSQSRGRG